MSEEQSEDNEPEEFLMEFTATPKVFHSFEHDCPFEKCSACGGDISDDGDLHLVEKAYQGEEVVFEYALCLVCQMSLFNELSEGSRRVLDNFFSEHVDFGARKKQLISQHGLDHQPWIEHCVICGRHWKELKWRQVVALCDGPDLLFIDRAPFMLCEDELEKIQGLLSKKTKDTMGDFFDEIIGAPTDATDLPMFV